MVKGGLTMKILENCSVTCCNKTLQIRDCVDRNTRYFSLLTSMWIAYKSRSLVNNVCVGGQPANGSRPEPKPYQTNY